MFFFRSGYLVSGFLCGSHHSGFTTCFPTSENTSMKICKYTICNNGSKVRPYLTLGETNAMFWTYFKYCHPNWKDYWDILLFRLPSKISWCFPLKSWRLAKNLLNSIFSLDCRHHCSCELPAENFHYIYIFFSMRFGLEASLLTNSSLTHYLRPLVSFPVNHLHICLWTPIHNINEVWSE